MHPGKYLPGGDVFYVQALGHLAWSRATCQMWQMNLDCPRTGLNGLSDCDHCDKMGQPLFFRKEERGLVSQNRREKQNEHNLLPLPLDRMQSI